ncbi:MAG: osmotically-inducible lipoprotein B [Longimicrobiales bacterium]
MKRLTTLGIALAFALSAGACTSITSPDDGTIGSNNGTIGSNNGTIGSNNGTIGSNN